MVKRIVVEEELRKQRSSLIEENERLQSDKKTLQDIQELMRGQERKQSDILKNDEELFKGSRYEYFVRATNDSLKQDQYKFRITISESYNNILKKIKENEEEYLQNEKALNRFNENDNDID